MGNQHSHQLNLKQLNKKIKQKSRINLSLPNANKKNIKERGSAFLCHSNGSLIANVQFKCNFCSTIKRSSFAIRQHYAKRHHFTESTEQLNEVEPKNYFASSIEQVQDDKPKTNCTLFIQDNELIIRCSSLNYGTLKFDEHEDVDGQRESDLRLKRINELSKLRQELTKLNAFSRLVESVEKSGPVRGHSIRLRKFDDDTNLNGNSTISNETEDQLNNNHYYTIKSKDDKFKKVPNSASDGSNSSSSSLCQSDVEQTQDLFDDLTKEVERLSETSSVDTTFGLDARCSVCNAKNYVVCIQSRLGKLICAVCFRYFKHFLSEPVVYACDQLGKCDLSKPIKPISSHTSHSQQKKLSSGTASKHVVKQQQLGIFKSKSNTLQSTPKVRRPLQQKELSFYSIASYSNNNSLSDQSKSMTLNLPPKNYSFKDRLSPTNQSNWTTPSPTQSNVSFALKHSASANHELDANFNSSLNMNSSPSRSARCNACWIQKCINIYYEVQFDEKIIKILNDFHPIQLSNVNKADESNHKNQSKFSQQQSIAQLNNSQTTTTLTKQKRYYTNNKLKSKSVSRLYYNSSTDKSPAKVEQLTNQTNVKKPDHSQTNSLLNESINGSNCSNDSNTTVEFNNKNDQSSNANEKIKNELVNGPSKATRLSSIPTPSKVKSNGMSTNRSNSSSSTDASNATKNSSKNTITLNNLPFKSNALNSLNKSKISKHSSILPGNNLPIGLTNSTTSEQNEVFKSNLKSPEKSFETEYCEMKFEQCSDQAGIKTDEKDSVTESENVKIDRNNTVRLIFKNEPETNSKETNINTIEILNSTENNNLNLLLNTHIHNIPERV